jgi:hypothetical protein
MTPTKLCLILSCLLLAGCKVTPFEATVVEKVYRPSTESVGFGSGSIGGKSGTVLTVSGSPEEYDVIVKSIFYTGKVEVPASVYVDVRPGSIIHCESRWYGFDNISIVKP